MHSNERPCAWPIAFYPLLLGFFPPNVTKQEEPVAIFLLS